jgi:hypothetical protein
MSTIISARPGASLAEVGRGFQRGLSAAEIRGMSSPWGAPDTGVEIAEGIVKISTASHGGYWVSDTRLAAMPKELANIATYAGHGWYEEDCDWALVALAYPLLFKPGTLRVAISTVGHFPHLSAAKTWLAGNEAQIIHSLVNQYVRECGHLFEIEGYSYGPHDVVNLRRVDGKQTAVLQTQGVSHLLFSQPLDLAPFGEKVTYQDVQNATTANASLA